MSELKSNLPYGKPFPVGDEQLWNDCMMQALREPYDGSTVHVDVMSLYASARGISRAAAKHETFVFRYGTGGTM